VVQQQNNGKRLLSEGRFVVRAIKLLRTGKQKGLHAAGGFTDAFRQYYGMAKDADILPGLQRLEKRGTIAIRPNSKGVILYLPSEAPKAKLTGELVLKTMKLA